MLPLCQRLAVGLPPPWRITRDGNRYAPQVAIGVVSPSGGMPPVGGGDEPKKRYAAIAVYRHSVYRMPTRSAPLLRPRRRECGPRVLGPRVLRVPSPHLRPDLRVRARPERRE